VVNYARLGEQLLRFFILIGFLTLFYRVLTTKEILQMIHPQFTFNAKLGFALLALLAILQFLRLLPSGETHECGCSHHFASLFHFVFIGTLVFGLVIPLRPLDSVIANQKGDKFLFNTKINNTIKQQIPFDNYEPLISVKKEPPNSAANFVGVRSAEKSTPPVINITDKNHVPYMVLLYENTQAYIGKQVAIKGFVYRPPNLAPNRFMVARFEISCCAADGVPSGLVVEWPDADKIKNDSWLEVQGAINQGFYQETPVPLLKAEKISHIEPLSTPYVYAPTRVVNPLHQQGVPQNIPDAAPADWKQ